MLNKFVTYSVSEWVTDMGRLWSDLGPIKIVLIPWQFPLRRVKKHLFQAKKAKDWVYTNRTNNKHFIGILQWKGVKVRLQGKVNIPKRERVTGYAPEPYQHLCKNNWKCFSAAALVACIAAAKQRWLHAAPVSHSPPWTRLPLEHFILVTLISLVFFPWFLGSLGSKKKMRSYDMGCDCGKQKETLAEKTACQKSALLEAPDQVYIILVIIDLIKICEQRVNDKDKKKKDMRIVGGCDAGHVPWYVFLEINGGYQKQTLPKAQWTRVEFSLPKFKQVQYKSWSISSPESRG